MLAWELAEEASWSRFCLGLALKPSRGEGVLGGGHSLGVIKNRADRLW